MPDDNTHENKFTLPKVMDKVKQYGCNHLLDQEKVQLMLELIGYDKENPGFKSVSEVFDLNPQKLREHLSKTQIAKLKSIRQLSAQYLKEELFQSKTVFSSPESVKDFLQLQIGAKPKEEIFCIFLDSKNQLIDAKTISKGTVDQVVIYAREIFQEALMCNATGVILAHNHPSGNPMPSLCDIKLTEQVQKGAEALDIRILDHMVIGKNDYYSFLENKLMDERKEYTISPKIATEKELISGKTLNVPPEEPERNTSKVFEDAINELKENEKYILNKRVEQLLGGRHLNVDDLPNTMYIIDKTYNSFISEYHASGYVDFEKIEHHVGTDGSSLYRIFDKEVYSFFEKNILEESERKKLSKLIPDAKNRQSLFADYARKKPIDLSHYTEKEAGVIGKMFKTIINGFFRLMGKKHELERLFEDFRHGRYEETQLQKDKVIINASELNRYSLKNVDMIIGDVDFGQANLPDLGDLQKITGKAIFSGSEIHSLGSLQSVGELDLRDSCVDDLGELKTVHGSVYSNSVSFEKWKEVEIEKDIISFGANMTSQYENLRNSPALEPEIAKDIDFGIER
jgi:DNA repair protein RadC